MEEKKMFVAGDRYRFDSGACAMSKGFAQLDTQQDASYYGNWANPFERRIVTFAEGDVSIRTFETEEEFVTGMRAFIQWTNDAGWTFFGIDCGLGPRGDALEAEFERLGFGEFLR